jgi:hypothetical protein
VWLKEHGQGERIAESEKQRGVGKSKVYSAAHRLLGDKIGTTPDYVAKIANPRHASMQFDTADKILCAIDRAELWWQHPELAGVYEKAVRGADRIYPIVEPEPDTRICDYCNEEFVVSKRHGLPRRFCSHACRQAEWMAKKKAA